ncbi:MAG: hypothetical protein WC343_08825 [Bacilli bacterium]|jgi:hypothetical protein
MILHVHIPRGSVWSACRSILQAACLGAGIFALLQIGMLARDLRHTSARAGEAITEARLAIVDARTYTAEQMARLRDPRNAKALDAAIQTAAVFNATGRAINTQLIPRAMQTLDGLSESAASLNAMIARTDASLNEGLVPGMTVSLQSADAALEELTLGLSDAHLRANATLDEARLLLADPSIKAALADIRRTTNHTAGIAADVDAATDRLPGIAEDIQKISNTSSRYAKPLALARIIALFSQFVDFF